jgi:hypothetical protein
MTGIQASNNEQTDNYVKHIFFCIFGGSAYSSYSPYDYYNENVFSLQFLLSI